MDTQTRGFSNQTEFELFHASDEFLDTALSLGRRTTIDEIRYAFMRGKYQQVHTFKKTSTQNLLEQLEEIFKDSQNIEESWRGEDPCRSTSVGDIIRVDNQYWLVAGRGFVLGWSGGDMC